jgi:hypothetical protein
MRALESRGDFNHARASPVLSNSRLATVRKQPLLCQLRRIILGTHPALGGVYGYVVLVGIEKFEMAVDAGFGCA